MYRKGCRKLVNNKGDKEFVSFFMRFTCTLIEAVTKIKRVGITAFIALLVAINDVAQVFACVQICAYIRLADTLSNKPYI